MASNALFRLYMCRHLRFILTFFSGPRRYLRRFVIHDSVNACHVENESRAMSDQPTTETYTDKPKNLITKTITKTKTS